MEQFVWTFGGPNWYLGGLACGMIGGGLLVGIIVAGIAGVPMWPFWAGRKG